MSHIPGHWQDDELTLAVGAARAKEKFGILLPSDEKKKPIPFPILFINNRNYRREDFVKAKADPDARIGFHLALIPFEDETGKEVSNLAIAYDIVDYEEHLRAESEFQTLIKRPGNKSMYRSNGSTESPMEQYSDVVIKKISEQSKNKRNKWIMKQTGEYVATPSFVKIYRDQTYDCDPMLWMKDAIKKGKLLGFSDFCQSLVNKLKVLL